MLLLNVPINELDTIDSLFLFKLYSYKVYKLSEYCTVEYCSVVYESKNLDYEDI